MNKYEIIVYWSEADSAYIAEVPELPGCAADGTSYGDVIQNIQVVIDEWIQSATEMGRKIPVPRGRLVFA